MTTQDIVDYYTNLLVIQYANKPKALATTQALAAVAILPTISVQQMDFSAVPELGTFKIEYLTNQSAAINYNDSISTVQSKMQAVSGLSEITVTGSLASQQLIVTLNGVYAPAPLLVISQNTLLTPTQPIEITVESIDMTLPLAVQNAYNLLGDSPAVGVQLDVLGKYVGVTRNGYSIAGEPITLDDADFLTLINMGITINNGGSDLKTIVGFLNTYFPGLIYVFDNGQMHLTYYVNMFGINSNLLNLFITEGLLPAPNGVGTTVIYIPFIDHVFRLVTYDNPVEQPNSVGLNNYDTFNTSTLFVSYSNVI